MTKRKNTIGTTWQYDAFISYRHSELDSLVAGTLHKQLESFKLPAKVIKERKEEVIDQKTCIHRVFRDKEELPLVANLADPITDALRNSEYLIVICSPRLNESMWCRKEIETFIEMHDREHVLAVLAEGEPDTSFPEELLYRQEDEVQTDGSVIKRKIPVEPLAADVRGANRREIKKKIKSELLRLVAPMFGCNYDDLKQRHREQKTRKVIVTSVAISAVCLLFGAVSTTMALRIQHQNTQITQQAKEISAQAQKIETQYEQAKLDTCISQSKEALNYLEDGDRMMAIATAQDAIWDLSDRTWSSSAGYPIEEGVEYPAQAIYALSESLYLYENGQQILPDRILEADTTIRYMKLSAAGSRIAVMDASGQLTVWNLENTREQARIATDSVFGVYENEIAFYGEDKLFCPGKDEVILYDVSGETAEVIYSIPCENYVGILVQHEKGQAILLQQEKYCVIDCMDGSVLYAADWNMGDLTARKDEVSILSEDGDYWAVVLSSPFNSDEAKRMVAVYDTETGELLNGYDITYEIIHSMQFDGNRIYIVSNHNGGFDAEGKINENKGRLQAFEIQGSINPLWIFERQDEWLFETSYAHVDGSDYLLCSGSGDVVVLNKQDGSYINEFSFGTGVVQIGNYEGSDNFFAFTRDGVWHYLNLDRMEDMIGELFPACTSNNVKEFDIGSNYWVTLPYNSRVATVYKAARGIGLEKFYDGEYSYKSAAFSADGSFMAAAIYNDLYTTAVELFDIQTGEKLWTYEEEDSYYQSMFFGTYDGEERLVIVTDREVVILDPAQGHKLSAFEICANGKYIDSDAEHQNIFIRDYTAVYCYDVMTGECIYTMEPTELDGQNEVAVSHSMAFYAVADQDEKSLCFYMMGENEPFLKEFADYLNFAYIETMFFGSGDEYLYIVYKDGRIATMGMEPQNQRAEYFCVFLNRSKYEELDDVMRSYYEVPDTDYAVMRGDYDSYLMEVSTGNLLAHLHGFMGYDPFTGQMYLHDKNKIYRIPLYTLEEINDFAFEVRDSSRCFYRVG